jgi:hypothetical protein
LGTTTVMALGLSMTTTGAAEVLDSTVQLPPEAAHVSFVNHAAPAASGWPQAHPGPRPTVRVGNAVYPAANPYLAMLPSTEGVDWDYWERWQAYQAAEAPRSKIAAEALRYDEQEPALLLGSNDTPRSAERIDGFGTGTGQTPALTVAGNLARERVPIQSIRRSREDDGAIPLARATGLGKSRQGIRLSGRIGDGPHGAAGTGSGDFDYMRVTVPAGEQLVATMAAANDSELQPLLAIWTKRGRLLDFSFPNRSGPTVLAPRVRPGTYYLMAGGCCTYPESRFRSGSGDGAGSEGAYKLNVTVSTGDRDFYSVELDKGDVLGGTLRADVGRLSIYSPGGTKVFGSEQDASFIYPASTRLPGGGTATVDHVVARSGRYLVEVRYGLGAYRVRLEAYRAGLEQEAPAATQTLFLDFNGERLNTRIFGGPGVRSLSPLSAFLGRWGLSADRKDEVVDAVVASMEENLRADLQAHGLGDVDIRILNSRDHADPWGEPNVSRLIIGGTIAQSGIPTIGVAESIDPGNQSQEETALLLLDYLSGPKDNEFSINHWFGPGSDKVAFIGQVLGNIAAHEAGHFLGNWHVDQFDGKPNLMDQGGNARALFGPGRDNIGGTADDNDVDFGVNRLNPFEGFLGLENTAARTGLGLLVGQP